MGITNIVTVRFELTVSVYVEIETIGLGIEGIQVIIIASIDTKIQTTSTITEAIQTISNIVTIKIEINTFLYPIAKAATN